MVIAKMNFKKLATFTTLFAASMMMFSGVADAATSVRVKNGDTVWGLSQKYNVDIDAIETANNIDANDDLIYIGQNLVIPDAKAVNDHSSNVNIDTVLANGTGAQQAKDNMKMEADKAAAQKAAEQRAAEDEAAAQAQREADARAAETAAANARAKAEADAQAKAVVQQSTPAPQATQSAPSAPQSTSGASRTMTCSFYDPSVLGSSLGYGGVAANLSVYPRGTRLKIEMSNGQVLYRTVNDTGSFAAGNPNQLDIAMPNSMVPAAGILSATVTVVG